MSDHHKEVAEGSSNNPIDLTDDDVSVSSSQSPASRTAVEDERALSSSEPRPMVAETDDDADRDREEEEVDDDDADVGFDLEPSAESSAAAAAAAKTSTRARGQKRSRVPETDDEAEDDGDEECEDESETCRPEKRARHEDNDEKSACLDDVPLEFSNVSPETIAEAKSFAEQFMEDVETRPVPNGDRYGYRVEQVYQRLEKTDHKPTRPLPKSSEDMANYLSGVSHSCVTEDSGRVYYVVPHNGTEFRRCFGDSAACRMLDMGMLFERVESERERRRRDEE